jgi:nucleoside-diphosphate-sugar epimerase
MRVFVAGASGPLGSRLVPRLIEARHEVIGAHKSQASAQLLEVLGAKPVRLDLLDARAVRTAWSTASRTRSCCTYGSTAR